MIFLLVVMHGVLYASGTDSLQHALEEADHDTTRINILLELVDASYNTSPSKAEKYVKRAESLVKELLESDDFAVSDFAKKAYGNTQHLMGNIAKRHGKYEKAIAHFRNSADIFIQYKNFEDAVMEYINAGSVHRIQGKYEKAMQEIRKGLKLAKKHQIKRFIGTANLWLGVVHRDMGNYDTAVKYIKRNLEVVKALKDRKRISASYNTIGTIMYYKGNYSKALDYFMKSLKIREELGPKRLVASSYNNIGSILMMQEHYEEALEYYKKYLNISIELQNKRNEGMAYSNIGIIHQNLGKKPKAVTYYKKSMAILRELGDRRSLSNTLLNLGDLYVEMQRFEKAEMHLTESLEIASELGAKGNKATALVNMAILKERTGNPGEAVRLARQSLDLTKKLGALEEQRYAYKTLANAYGAQNMYQEAFQAHKQYKAISDSIFSEEKHKQIAELETKYQTEKKEQENKLLKKQNELKNLKIRRQRTFSVAIVLVAILLVALGVVVFISRMRLKRINKVLRTKNEEINRQKEELNVQNDYIKKQHDLVSRQKDQITDSINYASRIQQAVLPLDERLDNQLGAEHYFILYKPRDIVSGDFYWFFTRGSRRYFVVADCTGHGVPGAFMSLIGIDLLNKIVSEDGDLHAEELLHKMHDGVLRALNQESSDSRDGMDIGALIFDQSSNIVEFSGAKLPLFFVDQEAHTFKGNRMPIGKMHVEISHDYTRHSMKLEAPTHFYLFTDGYPDQIGGMKQRKYMVGNFRSFLQKISEYPMTQQKHMLEEELENWMQTAPQQIDDILVMGIRLEPA